MDHEKFDDLVKKLSAGTSRRKVVGQGLGVAGATFIAAASDIAGKVKGGNTKDTAAGTSKGKGKSKGKKVGGGASAAAEGTAAPQPTEDAAASGDADGPGAEGCIATGKKCRKKKNGRTRDRCDTCCSQLSDGKTCICREAGGSCSGDANCCTGSCVDGVCADGPGPACRELGQSCKNSAPGCCQGLVCSSGQGGEEDVACYVPKTGACEKTADCVYGTQCIDGRCSPPPPAGLAQPCAATVGQGCTTPGAICTAYTGAGAPNGTFCTLPIGASCTGDPDCTCYSCGTPNLSGASRKGGKKAGKQQQADAAVVDKACCGKTGIACTRTRDCCSGYTCIGGFCGFAS